MMPDKRSRLGEIAWILAVSGQGGLMLALPVVCGLGLGYMLDRYFGTLPWLTLALTLIGAIIGPVLLYRWATSMVRRRLQDKEDGENS
jgi:F0F1-type ATP synthase assembly protein I